MMFSEALAHSQQGSPITRAAWEPSGLFLFWMNQQEIEFKKGNNEQFPFVGTATIIPTLVCMLPANFIQSYIPSPADMLADDWVVVTPQVWERLKPHYPASNTDLLTMGSPGIRHA